MAAEALVKEGNLTGVPEPDSIEMVTAKVQKSLEGTPYACITLEKLSGGSANFVYRGTLVKPLGDGARTIVLKHTEGYVATAPGFLINVNRCKFENEILTACQNLLPASQSNIIVQTPKIYPFNQESNTQIYSDLALSTDMKTYCLTHKITHKEATRLGVAIGRWAKSFHTWGAAPEQSELRSKMKESTEMRALKYQINYPTMVATIENFPDLLEDSRSVLEAVAKDVKERLDAEDGTLIHGDFWTGNVVMPNVPIPVDDPMKLYIVDWELVQLAILAFDLGQMTTELYELKLFKDIDAGESLVKAFVDGYGPIDIETAFTAIIFVGNHLLCWGTRVPGWGSEERIREVVKVGRDFVVKGWKKDAKFFRETPWAKWFGA